MSGLATRIEWRARRFPLEPEAVAGRGKVAMALAARCSRLPERVASKLEAVLAKELLILLGDSDALPWVDGVCYLGRDPATPRLLLPTVLEPAVSPELLEQAIRGRFPAVRFPLAVLLGPDELCPLDRARPLAALLEAWPPRS
jgi:hypothetical protein